MSSFQEINVEDLQKLIADSKAVTIIDNRAVGDFSVEHIPNAIKYSPFPNAYTIGADF